MPGRHTVASSVLEMLGAAGVETAFGLPGVHNLAFWSAETGGGPRIIGVRHEQTTVYAADGLARATGGVGAALTTTGPGAANAVAAFGEAAASGTPLILIASEVSTALHRPGVVRGILHESSDQAGMFEPLAKALYRPREAPAAIAALASAIETATTWPRGPVYLDIPTDVLEQPAEPEPVAAPRRRAPDDRQLSSAVAMIRSAGTVVVWAGSGVVQSGAEPALARFARLVGAPVITTFGAHGAIPADHPCFVGLPPHEPEIARLIGAADLLVGVGSDFDGMNTRNWSMPRPPRLVNINCDTVELGKNYVPDVAVLGDVRLALEGLVERLEDLHRPAPAAAASARAAVLARLASDPASAPAVALVGLIDEVTAHHDAVVVNDMCIPGYWVGGYSKRCGTRRLQYPMGWGTLGYALPAAIGAATGPRPVVAVCGDGGFMFALGELAVIAEHQLPVTLLLVDDGGYGMLRYDQARRGEAERGVNLGRPDFAALVSAFGIPVTRRDAIDADLATDLERGVSSGGPRVVVLRQALTPPRTTSPRWHD